VVALTSMHYSYFVILRLKVMCLLIDGDTHSGTLAFVSNGYCVAVIDRAAGFID